MFRRFISISVFWFYSSVAFCWNFTGHVVVAQIAYDNLTASNQIKADKLADIIFNQLAQKQQDKLNRQYANATTFAKVAVLPDIWRKWKLGTIFAKFDAPIPLNLLFVSQHLTANWHFIDMPYPAKYLCSPRNADNVIGALQKIEPDIQHTTNNNSKALLMVLTEHYMGDIHQPLHTMTHLNGFACQDDRGGNDFCLKVNKKGKCNKSLHALWDSAGGLLKPHSNIQKLAYDLQHDYPMNHYAIALTKTDLSDWVHNSYQKANFIYSTPQLATPNPTYYMTTQLIAKEQIVLAGYRLAQALNRDLNINLAMISS